MLIKSQRGFTLIEAIVAMAIMAVLLAMAAPSISQYSQNAKIRSEAESLASGLQSARAEAVRLNAAVEFILTDADPTDANVNTTALSASGKNWMVRTKDPADLTNATYLLVLGKAAKSGSGRTDGTSAVTVAGASGGNGINQLRFNNLSSLEVNGTAATAPAVFSVKYPTAGVCTSTSVPTSVRCLNVQVSVSGQVKICDPAVTDATDTRKCP